MMLDQIQIEDYTKIDPDMNSPKPNGFKTLPKGDTAYINPTSDVKFTGIIEFVPNTGLRGNHYHKEKHEILYIISGKLKAQYWTYDEPQKIKTLIHVKGEKITIPAFIGHAFEAIEHSIVLELTTTNFDIQDTYYVE